MSFLSPRLAIESAWVVHYYFFRGNVLQNRHSVYALREERSQQFVTQIQYGYINTVDTPRLQLTS